MKNKNLAPSISLGLAAWLMIGLAIKSLVELRWGWTFTDAAAALLASFGSLVNLPSKNEDTDAEEE